MIIEAISWLFLYEFRVSFEPQQSSHLQQRCSATNVYDFFQGGSILSEVFKKKLMRAQTCHTLLLLVLMSMNYTFTLATAQLERI